MPKKSAVHAGARSTARGDGRDTQQEVEQFLYRQAALLDGQRWQEYIDLFAVDGRYWMPASPEQVSGEDAPSIFYEDRDLMTVRMKRLQHPDAWSQKPAWGTNHVVSNVMIESENQRTGRVAARSRFHMLELRRDATRHFGGSYWHQLQRTRDGFAIELQRVDMVNGQAPYDFVLLAWV